MIKNLEHFMLRFFYAPLLAWARKCPDSPLGIKKPDFVRFFFVQSCCREEGIRTLDTVSRIHTFQACSFNHSDTSLYMVVLLGCKYRRKSAESIRFSKKPSP